MPTEPAMRVAIADDSLLFRAAAVRLLEDAGFDVVAEAGDGDDLLRKVRAHRPDVAIVDIRMPPDHTDEGLRAARAIRAGHPGVGVLVLSQHVEAGQALELLAHGTEGIGYLLKDRVSDIARFADAVRQVGEGGSVLDAEVVAPLVGRRDRDPLDALADRDRDVLAQMATGASNRAIAQRMFLSERAVERHITAIFEALGLGPSRQAHRRVLAVLAYLRTA
jgi:DNA-binding NarL/FixJ family response regulator